MGNSDIVALIKRITHEKKPDLKAWQELQLRAEPTITAVIRRSRRLQRAHLAHLPDDQREVLVRSLERLKRDQFARLRGFLAHLPKTRKSSEQAFDDWLYGAVDYEIREHIRARIGRINKSAQLAAERKGEPRKRSKRELNSRAARLDETDIQHKLVQSALIPAQVTAAQVLSFIRREFTKKERIAFHLWCGDGLEPEELAHALKLESPKQAHDLIRALVARLRFHLGDGAGIRNKRQPKRAQSTTARAKAKASSARRVSLAG